MLICDKGFDTLRCGCVWPFLHDALVSRCVPSLQNGLVGCRVQCAGLEDRATYHKTGEDMLAILSESRKTTADEPVSVSVPSFATARMTPNAGWSRSG